MLLYPTARPQQLQSLMAVYLGPQPLCAPNECPISLEGVELLALCFNPPRLSCLAESSSTSAEVKWSNRDRSRRQNMSPCKPIASGSTYSDSTRLLYGGSSSKWDGLLEEQCGPMAKAGFAVWFVWFTVPLSQRIPSPCGPGGCGARGLYSQEQRLSVEHSTVKGSSTWYREAAADQRTQLHMHIPPWQEALNTIHLSTFCVYEGYMLSCL